MKGLTMTGLCGDKIATGHKRVENRLWSPKTITDEWIILQTNSRHPHTPKQLLCAVKIAAILRPSDALRLFPEQTRYITDLVRNHCWIISHVINFPIPINLERGGPLGLWSFTGERQAAGKEVESILNGNPAIVEHPLPAGALVACIRKGQSVNKKRRRADPKYKNGESVSGKKGKPVVIEISDSDDSDTEELEFQNTPMKQGYLPGSKECVICLESANEISFGHGCTHHAHGGCLEQWFSINRKLICPECKAPSKQCQFE